MDLKKLKKGMKGLELKGTIDKVFERREVKGISERTGKPYDFHSQSIIVVGIEGDTEDLQGELIGLEADNYLINLTHCDEITDKLIGKMILLHKAETDEYTNKKGELVKKINCSKISVEGLVQVKEEKASVIENSTTPLPDKEGITESPILVEILTKVNELVNWIMVENNPVFRTPKEKPVKKLQDISVEDNHAEVMDELTPEQLSDLRHYKGILGAGTHITEKEFDNAIKEEEIELVGSNFLKIKECCREYAKLVSMTPKEK